MKGYLPTLDGWRALAVAAVIVCHAGGTIAPEWRWLTVKGAVGVDVFFAISGLLICGRLLEEWKAEGGVDLGAFYTRRAFRILPAYWFYLGAAALLVHPAPRDLAACLLFVRNYLPAPANWFTGHFWSLAVEEHFYMLLPGALYFLGPRRLRIALPAAALAIAVWRMVDFRWHVLTAHIPGVSFLMRTDIRLDGLLWGAFAAVVLHSDGGAEFARRWLGVWTWRGAALAFVACVLWQPPLAMLWIALLAPVLLAGTVLHPHRHAGRVLDWEPLRWVGRLSYSLYLWQQLFFAPEGEPRVLGAWQEWPLAPAGVLACALISYLLVEQPLIRLGRRAPRMAAA